VVRTLLDSILREAEIIAPPSVVPGFFQLVVGGSVFAPPAGVSVINHLASSVHRFHPRRTVRSHTVDELVIHETQTSSTSATVKTLRGKNASVHLIVGSDGRVTQHGDLLVRMEHAEPHNSRSVGIEVVNPYVATRLKPPWAETVEARWSARGYVLPTPTQAEVVTRLVDWLTRTKAGHLNIPRTWIGESSGHLSMSLLEGAGSPSPGIYAHTYFCPTKCGCDACRESPERDPCRCKHADGAWLVLYAWLRLEARQPPRDAYANAKALGAGARIRRIKAVRGSFPVKLPARPSPRRPADPLCVVPHSSQRELESEAAEGCERVPVASAPTPGRFYTIRAGIDSRGLLDLAGRAYGVPAGEARKRLARTVNDHPYNRRFRSKGLADASFPDGRISFRPIFTADVGAQARAAGAAPSGRAFATIWIPPRPAGP
jgi:hypothetical protein